MKRKFIIDKEINLNEADFLKTKPYADNLVRIINNTEENKVFTIGLFGSWGSGKSSIIETASKDFDSTKVKFINYDAWQYANDSFRRMFLRNLRKELGLDESELMKKFYENESADIGYKYQLSTTRLLWILSGIFLVILLIWILPFETDFKVPVYSLLTLIGLFITVISGAFNQLKISITKPLFFAPEQFENCFKEMASVALKKYEWYENIIFTIAGNKSVKNLDKLVIVIDNIDRCNNDIAYQLLTDIKTFLANDNYSIVFVIPVDDEALRKHLFRINKLDDEDISVKEKEEFLRKFFNVVIRIKPYQETDMFEYAKRINQKYNLGFKVDTLSLAAKEYSTNPRRVLQLFNNLISELSNYSDIFSNNNETVICAILILREEFSTYYKDVVNSPKLFLEENVNTGNINAERIQRFNRITRNIKVNTSLSDLAYILTNSSSIFDDIRNDLKDSVDTFDIEKINAYFENNTDVSKFIEYLIHKIRVTLNNGLDSDLANYFDIIAQLNLKLKFDRSINSRFYEVFENKIEFIIEHSNNYANACKYANCLSEQRLTELKKRLINKSNSTNSEMPFWNKLFNAIVSEFQDIETSKKLSEIYEVNYSIVSAEIEFSKEQYDFLLNERYVQKRIEMIGDLSNSEKNYTTVINIFQNRSSISIETVNNFIKKVVSLVGDSHNKAQSEIVGYLKFVNRIISVLPDGKLETSFSNLEQFHNYVILRRIADPNVPHNRRLDRDISLIDGCNGNEDELKECIDYLINVYRLTKSNIDIETELRKLSENREYLNEKLVALLQSKFDLFKLRDFILSDRNYASENTLKLFGHVLLSIGDMNSILGDVKDVSEEINALLEFAHTQNSTAVYSLLKGLSQQNELKESIGSCIMNKSSQFVNSLPQFISRLAIDKFTEQNYFEFKDNFPFLEVIASKGSEIQVSLLVKLVNEILVKNEISLGLLQVIAVLRPSKKSDRKILKSQLEYAVENLTDMIDSEQSKLLEETIRSLSI